MSDFDMTLILAFGITACALAAHATVELLERWWLRRAKRKTDDDNGGRE